jgi:hypothetical protein
MINMKNIIVKKLTYLLVGMVWLASCNDPVTEFGFDGQLVGKVVDGNGNIVSGDIKSATYAVQAKGDNDLVSMVMRVKGDGTYANLKLYPQLYDVTLVGPFIESPLNVGTVDLTGGKSVEKDFQVTPLLTIPAPVVNGNPSATEIKIDFNIAGNGGNTPNLREIIVSTVAWPTRTTGTGSGYFTKMTTVSENQGTATVTGLQPNTKYYVRIGARAAGQSLFNLSEQISVTTPGS